MRSEEYIHLRDIIVGDIDHTIDLAQIGKRVILASSFIGGPRNMQEYTQDSMTYVRNCGRPDLFITFTCNPQWEEITDLLSNGQRPPERHDIVARVFKQKLNSLRDLLTKHKVFGEVRCWTYSVEWQKRGLPHAHILLWLLDRIGPDEIDKIISAEIPDRQTDPELFEIVTKHMFHGPCGSQNPNSPCMGPKGCTKRFPKAFENETITGDDGIVCWML